MTQYDVDTDGAVSYEDFKAATNQSELMIPCIWMKANTDGDEFLSVVELKR